MSFSGVTLPDLQRRSPVFMRTAETPRLRLSRLELTPAVRALRECSYEESGQFLGNRLSSSK